MKNSVIFNKAAELIMERGHAKGVWFQDDRGALCLFGACGVAREGGPTEYGEDLRLVIERYANTKVEARPVTWNDLPDTTPDEVVQVLQFMALAEKDAGR